MTFASTCTSAGENWQGTFVPWRRAVTGCPVVGRERGRFNRLLSLLGVEPKATPDEIKRAYRKLVFQYHPDRNPDNREAAEKVKEIMAAYDVLSNEEDRAQYNKSKGFRNDKGADGKKKPRQRVAFSRMNSSKRLEPEPQCPACSVVGMDHVISRKSGSGMGAGKAVHHQPVSSYLLRPMRPRLRHCWSFRILALGRH